MTYSAKVSKVGNSSALIIPRDLMDKLRLEQGDTVTISDTEAGLLVSPYDEAKTKQLDIAHKIMRENRNMLRKLAE